MSLSATADHALRAVLVLARASAGGRPARTADELAAATGAPRNYLSKTLHALARAGVLTGTRGPHGGFALAVDPAALTIAGIVDLFGAPRPHTRCLLGSGPCDAARACAAHHRWTAVLAARRAPLAATTIAELAGLPTAVTPAPDAGAVLPSAA
jgi:Rrf2 family protein